MSLCLCGPGHPPVKERSHGKASPCTSLLCRAEPSLSELLSEGTPALTHTPGTLTSEQPSTRAAGLSSPPERTMGFVQGQFPDSTVVTQMSLHPGCVLGHVHWLHPALTCSSVSYSIVYRHVFIEHLPGTRYQSQNSACKIQSDMEPESAIQHA